MDIRSCACVLLLLPYICALQSFSIITICSFVHHLLTLLLCVLTRATARDCTYGLCVSQAAVEDEARQLLGTTMCAVIVSKDDGQQRMKVVTVPTTTSPPTTTRTAVKDDGYRKKSTPLWLFNRFVVIQGHASVTNRLLHLTCFLCGVQLPCSVSSSNLFFIIM